MKAIRTYTNDWLKLQLDIDQTFPRPSTQYTRFTYRPCKSARNTVERFLSKCAPWENGCIQWMGSKVHGDYGRLRVNQNRVRAPRFAFFLRHGRLPSKHVLHVCDNPSCVNPDHLLEGSDLDNSRDSVSKLRHAYGERNGRSVLTTEQVRYIKKHHVFRKVTAGMLADQLGVKKGTVKAVISGANWRLVDACDQD